MTNAVLRLPRQPEAASAGVLQIFNEANYAISIGLPESAQQIIRCRLVWRMEEGRRINPECLS